MYLNLFNPPSAVVASGTKEGVELGGNKCLLSIDGSHQLYNEAEIFTEMSWAEFYKEEGIEDQIDTFTTKKYDSVRDDPDALIKRISECLQDIMRKGRLFYGILDLEVDAFLNRNTVIPGLKLDPELINKLMNAHKKDRDENRFPTLIQDERGTKFIKISYQGSKKGNVVFTGNSLGDIADKIRMAKGFATGLVVSNKKVANFFIMNDNIVFAEDVIQDFYIDEDCITVIELGVERNLLFPISWFRIDIGIRSLETLELWSQIENNRTLRQVLENYNLYLTRLIIKKYKNVADSKDLGINIEEDFYNLTGIEKQKALKDMAEAVKILTEKYYE